MEIFAGTDVIRALPDWNDPEACWCDCTCSGGNSVSVGNAEKANWTQQH